MAAAELKSVVQRYFEGAYQDEGATLVDQFLAPDYVGHFPPNPDVRGQEAVKQFNRETRSAFPDVQLTIEDLIAEGDKVVARWTLRGTHLGEMRGGIAPTGKSFTITGTSTNHFVDGKIAEGWGNIDLLGLFLQLGLVTPPGPTDR
jgi:predicted ester cyclase